MNSMISILVRSVGTIAALTAVLFCSLAAQAAPVSVYSNPFGEVVSTNSLVSGSNFFATGFTTGTDGSYLTLKSIDLALASSGTTASSTPIIRLFSGTSSPTTLLGNFTAPAITNITPQSFNLPYSTGNVVLSPQTNYWIVASASAGDAYGWYTADSNPTAQNASGYAYVAGRRSTDGGSNYANSNTAGLSQVAVNVEAVPEPSTLVLAGVGMSTALAVNVVRRKRRGSRQAGSSLTVDG